MKRLFTHIKNISIYIYKETGTPFSGLCDYELNQSTKNSIASIRIDVLGESFVMHMSICTPKQTSSPTSSYHHNTTFKEHNL